MTAPARATGAADGFTLVELLVAVSLVALLSVLLFGGLRFAMRAADAVDDRVDDAAQIAVAYNFMQNELADARPLPVAPDSTESVVNFTGAPDGISFVAVPPPYVALGGFHLLHVGLEGEGQDRQLVVSWQAVPRGPVATGPAMLQPSLLLDGVQSVDFAYFGVADPNRPPEWTDHWTGRRALPQLVRLRVAMADGWQAPDLIVAPRLAGPAQP